MGKIKRIAIDLDNLTAQDWADAVAIAAEGGVALTALDLESAKRDPLSLPLPALTALIHVARRKENPRVTAAASVRLACDALGVPYGE